MISPAARLNMVDGQLRPNKINNHAVLARFTTVPREDFVPAATRPLAYVDQPTPLGQGREMFSPLVTARLVQELDVNPEGTVLVLAGGTGYSTAILAGLAAHVIMVEDSADLFALAQLHFKSHSNVTLINANPATYKPGLTLNAILVDAPYAVLPNLATLVASLEEGGHMAGVRINADGIAEATLGTKHAKSLMEETLFETQGRSHPSFSTEETFVF